MPKLATQQEFINKAISTHGNKYNYSKVIYINSNAKVIITCNTHGDFEQRPARHVCGDGCKTCGIDSHRSNIEKFIEKAQIKHKNKYDYSKSIYVNSNTKIEIICPDHGSFWQIPERHYISGCQLCANQLIGKNLALSSDVFIERANNKHKNKYDYSFVKYKNIDFKVKIICKKHGEFLQTPYWHLIGTGCPLCAKSAGTSQAEQIWLNLLNIPLEFRQFQIKINNKKYKVDGFDPATNTVYEYNGDFWHGNPKIYNSYDYNDVSKATFGELYENTIKRQDLLKAAGYNLVVKWETEV